MPEPPSRNRPLSAEEVDLWLHAMRQARALQRRGRKAERERREKNEAEAEAASATVSHSNTTAKNQAAAPSVAPPPQQQKTKAARSLPSPQPLGISKGETGHPPPLNRFDERQRRKLAKDAELIEARLDLHGMRQREAHGALVSFLRSCAARGVRHVLVITGKGAPEGYERDYMQGEGRGVLRRLVPQWLAEPGFRGMVVSYTAAHARHGGEGALYVRLRKSGQPG